MGALVPAMGQANLTLANGHMTLVKTVVANAVDTLTMTGVVGFASGTTPTQLSVISSQPTLTTNWAGFRIDTYNNPLVAFRVACSTSQAAWQDVNFDLVQLNVGGGWITSSSAFIAPITGTYVLALTIGIQAPGAPRTILKLNEVKVSDMQGAIGCISTAPNLDLMSKTLVLSLVAGDNLTMVGNFYSDPFNVPTTFSGFLYSPTQVQPVSIQYTGYDSII